MMAIFEIIEGPVPDWMTLFDVGILAFAAFAVGIMLGHMLGKR